MLYCGDNFLFELFNTLLFNYVYFLTNNIRFCF